MNRRLIALLAVAIVAVGTAGAGAVEPASNHDDQQETYELDLDTEGAGSAASDGEAVQVEIDADGEAEVQDQDGSNDKAAFTEQPGDVTVRVNTSDGQSYEIPVQLGGQGSSFLAQGVDGWELYLQGTTTLDGSDDQVQFFGNFTLTGTDSGYAVNGTAILNVPDGQDTTTYHFAVTGEGEFAPAE